MKEVEILVQVLDDKNKILKSLKKFDFKGIKETLDIYFFDPLRKNLQVKEGVYPTEWFRIRKKHNNFYITYKEDIFDKKNKWIHSHEFETKIEDFDILKQIIEKLGFKELIKIKNIKHTYENKDYEIVFEEVENLGYFLEVEKLIVNEGADIKKIKKEIQEFINSLNFKIIPVNIGKPELMLKSKNIKN